jgi:ABC-2 type transport system ATP-binding protein
VVVSVALEDLRANYRRLNVVFGKDAPARAFAPAAVGQVRREGRTVSLIASNAEAIAADARRMSATSVDVMPVTLKELFLETVRNGKEA